MIQSQSNSAEDDTIQVSSGVGRGELIFPSHIPPQQSTNANVTLNRHASYSHSERSYTNMNSNCSTGDASGISSGSGHDSPFFRPSTPQPATEFATVSTPNGTHVMQKKRQLLIRRSKNKKTYKTDVPETKSSVIGTTANLINCIVGAGIIGIPYAMNQTGILAGIILIIAVAVLTDKSLRLLIETGKHANVQSYEKLMEAVFGGRLGFVFITVNMFLISFGAMVCYLLIIKQTFADIVLENQFMVDIVSDIGICENEGDGETFNRECIGRWVLIVSSLVIVLPLSTQRDMANLSTTSTLSVVFDILMVLIVAVSSPVKESIEQSGGITNVMKQSTIHMSTLFIGLGVLSFAFVCQDSSFIIAGSLERSTKKRWGVVTKLALSICAALAIIIGVAGYLGFQERTRGNILENFLELPKSEMITLGFLGSVHTSKAINMARTLLGLTMFCVYPLASYVARHVIIVLLFSGNTAQAGDDHSVLARMDRRIILTSALYMCALIPALNCNDLGTILALTGAVAGSSLSYLGPGIAYLGVHGLTFLDQVEQKWKVNHNFQKLLWKYPNGRTNEMGNGSADYNHVIGNISNDDNDSTEHGKVVSFFQMIVWYALFMPIWCTIASWGGKNFKEFEKDQALRSTVINKRLMKSPVINKKVQQKQNYDYFAIPGNDTEDGLPKQIKQKLIAPPSQQQEYGSINNPNLEQGTSGNASVLAPKVDAMEGADEKDLQETNVRLPTMGDFILAVSYILLGVVALVAGIFSITVQ